MTVTHDRPHLRPRFQTLVPCHPQKAFEKFRLRLSQPECPFEGMVLENYISLTVKPAERHYWSPVLNVQSEAVAGGTRLRGHYGPHPNVWTLLLAVAATFCFSGVFLTIYGCAQWVLNEAPWGLLALPGSLLGMGLVYAVAMVGQWKAHDQMLQLKSFFDVSVCAQELEQIAKAPPEHAGCAQCRQLCSR